MTNFSTEMPIIEMDRQRLLMEYLAINAHNCILIEENKKLVKKNKHLDNTLRSVVGLYLCQGKNE
jgi:hypothetical protein